MKNLARTFISVFADIKELMQYKSHAFLNGEMPKMGWGIVLIDPPPAILDKNYMEQTQYLRLIATTVGVPSHMVSPHPGRSDDLRYYRRPTGIGHPPAK